MGSVQTYLVAGMEAAKIQSVLQKSLSIASRQISMIIGNRSNSIDDLFCKRLEVWEIRLPALRFQNCRCLPAAGYDGDLVESFSFYRITQNRFTIPIGVVRRKELPSRNEFPVTLYIAGGWGAVSPVGLPAGLN
jgi:hypothetical protein